MKTLRRLLFSVLALGVLGVATLAGTSCYYGGDDGMGCARCHEIRPMVDAWAPSSHRNVDVQGLPRQLLLGRPAHAREEPQARRGCTRAARRRSRSTSATRTSRPSSSAAAPATARSAPTGRAGPTARRTRRSSSTPSTTRTSSSWTTACAATRMHFEGGIRDLVTPLDRKGPWTFVSEEYAGLPAVPCLTCHSVHRKGEPLAPRSDRGLVAGPAQEIARPSLALYDRRALEHVGLDRLPLPAMLDGERPVKTSPDRRQALCYQCHAPRAGDAGLLGRRPHAGRRPRGPELPGLPREARPDDARLVRRLPPAPLELRDRRRDDGHDLQVARQPPRRPPRGLPRLPPEGRAEEPA